MSGRGTTLGLALALAAWSGPVYAWAPEPAGDALAEDAPVEDAPVEDAPVEDAPVEEAVEPVEPPPSAAATDAVATHDVPADDFETEPNVAPGGYHGHGVILERAPPDGRNRIIVGSILAPLGTIATVTSAVGTWLTVPQHCGRRLASVGIEADASRCQGLFTFNVIRTTYGVLMLGSGATILALGIIQRERYRKWRHEHGMRARLEPALGGLRLRF